MHDPHWPVQDAAYMGAREQHVATNSKQLECSGSAATSTSACTSKPRCLAA